eukprot:567080-Hanusia_phi.AAC.1
MPMIIASHSEAQFCRRGAHCIAGCQAVIRSSAPGCVTAGRAPGPAAASSSVRGRGTRPGPVPSRVAKDRMLS